MAMLCPHCNMPMTDEESRSGACPVCDKPLPGMTPAVVSRPEPLPSNPPYSRVWLIGGVLGLLLLCVGLWFATGRPQKEDDEKKEEPRVADNRKSKEDPPKEEKKPLPEPKPGKDEGGETKKPEPKHPD